MTRPSIISQIQSGWSPQLHPLCPICSETLNGERKLKCRSRLQTIQEDLSRQSKSMNTERQKFVVNTWFIHFLIYSTGLPVLAANFQELLRVSTILHCFKNNQKKRSIGVNADDTTLSTQGLCEKQDGSCLSAKPKASKNWRLTYIILSLFITLIQLLILWHAGNYLHISSARSLRPRTEQ